MISTTAAVLDEVGLPAPYRDSRPLRVGKVELQPPGRGEVLIRIRAAGLCHSDLSVINGARPRPTPMVLGHEAAGVVEQLGPGVDGLNKGDHVVLVFVPSCGHCVPCAEGRPALCEPGAVSNTAGTLASGERRILRDGQALNHHLGVSAFARHAVVHQRSVVKIDKDLPFEEAAIFGCAVITGVGAVLNTAGVRAGASVAVVGLGGVGLNSVLGARVSGAREIVAIDLRPEKLELAKALGATRTCLATDPDCLEVLREETGGGVDFAFEMAGSVAALELAWRVTRRGGTTVTAGLTHPDASLPLSTLQLVAEERVLRGSYLGSCVPVRDVPRYIDLYRRGRLPVNDLMSERISLEDINAAFDRLASGETARQIVIFD